MTDTEKLTVAITALENIERDMTTFGCIFLNVLNKFSIALGEKPFRTCPSCYTCSTKEYALKALGEINGNIN